MTAEDKERIILAVSALTLSACVLTWITGAGRTGLFATAYLALAATCALYNSERKRHATTAKDSAIPKTCSRLDPSDRAAPCEGCLTVYHSECLDERDPCAILGCDADPSVSARVRITPGVRS